MFFYQVELFKHPHLLLLQIRNSIYKLPGGRLRPGESGIRGSSNIGMKSFGNVFVIYYWRWNCEFLDTDGLKRKLARKLSVNEDGDGSEWEVLNLSFCTCHYNLTSREHLNYNLLGLGGWMPWNVVEAWFWNINVSLHST